jgi:nicotinamidase-related amidase
MENRQHVWEDLINDEIRLIKENYKSGSELGDKPALLCIDNYNAVFGDRREPLSEAIKRFPSSCGERAWDAVEPTKKLLEKARAKKIPVIHTTRHSRLEMMTGIVSTKRSRASQDTDWAHAFFPPLAPAEDEIVIKKLRASAFFGTPLDVCLASAGVNTVIIVGNSTSGCIRATCVDAFMRGYAVAVVEECVFDRNLLSHKVNLFDMDCKYADVMFADEMIGYLDRLS